ncbi:MAG: hypothetical protein AABM42_05505 [Actinomycetota bacterium]
MTAAREVSGGADGGEADAVQRFVRAGLELLDLEAGEAEIAVIEAVDGLYRPVIERLLEDELDEIEPEPGTDMSRPPA